MTRDTEQPSGNEPQLHTAPTGNEPELSGIRPLPTCHDCNTALEENLFGDVVCPQCKCLYTVYRIRKLPYHGMPLHKTDGLTCGGCKHAVKIQHNNKDYWKCGLRKITRGAATDIRLKWPACYKWETK